MKFFGFTLSLLTSISASGLFADTWVGEKPSGMTNEHRELAIGAKRARDRASSFSTASLIEDHAMIFSAPLSNISKPTLQALLVGKYHIENVPQSDGWSVSYYAPDGATYFCMPETGRYMSEFTDMRQIRDSVVGLGAVGHWPMELDGEFLPASIVADPDTGFFFTYMWASSRNAWSASSGWLQEEYAPIFEHMCPELPDNGLMNQAQNHVTFQEMAANAKPVRGFKVEFKNNPVDPVTGGMFYWMYPEG